LSLPLSIPGASSTLRDRILGKIVMPGPATPCATWVGSYNRTGARTRKMRWGAHHRRPVIRAGGRGSRMVYVAPTMLKIAGVVPEHPAQIQACHDCPGGPAWHGVFFCVDLAHLRWGTQTENEADKQP
jgi:hypothetical protein